jgi:N-acetylmuramoyl-L-alanine amidase
MHLALRVSALLLVAALISTPRANDSALAEPSKAAKKKQAVVCDRSQFRVIIDVGHSAEVPGALSARGVGEYTFNFNLAQKIESKLLDAGFSKTVLLITPGKAIAGLVQRVNYTQRTPADLFLSIHHDAVPDSFLQKWTYQGRDHKYCDRFKGHSIFVSHDNDEYQTSLKFARLLGLQMKSKGLQYTPHYVEKFMGRRQRQLVDADAGVYRFDNLVVLRSTNMPAVLLEAGSIINRDEELLMSDPDHQALISTAVVDAVERFCATNPRKPEQRIARRPQQDRPIFNYVGQSQ